MFASVHERRESRNGANVFPRLSFARVLAAKAAAKSLSARRTTIMTVKRTPNTWSLIDVFDRVLDKGIVIDACCAPTLLDVMDHVLDKGVIVEAPTSAATEATSTSHIALLDVTVRVNVTTDAEDALKETTR